MRLIARLTLAFATALATVFALPAVSQDLPNRVGRIAHIEGAAALYQDPDEGWARAYVNSPVTSENSVWTDPGSRAEMRVGGIAMRLEEATQLDITRMDDDELNAFVPSGTVSIRMRHFQSNERVTFTTPHARFSIRANGRYRVDVDPDREESRLTVFAGEARVGSESGRIRVQAGKTVRVFGGSAPSYVVENAFRDPFDRWADARDAGWVESRSVKYVSASMTGYEDLDRHGTWREEPEFGALWFPTRVAADWAPYRHGRWDYVRPWGWTWVDDAPWGYAPFHYGRWVHVGDRWAWSPGRREVRPTWAPALVAFVGGSNFSVGATSGSSPSVGWYPLSPWERYQPWYNASPTYVNQVNVVVRESPQRDDRRAEWRERSRERGVTVVNRDVVVDRRPVQQALVAVRPEVARQAQAAAPSIVLPSRNEVIQRRQAQAVRAPVVTPVATPATAPAAAPGAAPATQRQGAAPAAPAQRGERAAGPVARPDFQRRQAAAPPPPEPAKAAPPPAQPVTPPSDAGRQQSREQILKARDEQMKAREDQMKGRDQPGMRASEQKARDDLMKGREAEQQKARADQMKAVEDSRKAREDQLKGRDAEQQKAREDQQKAREQQQQQQQQQQKAIEDQRKARDDQMKGREAEQQKAREDQLKAREQQQQQQQQQQQKAIEDQRKARDDQMKGREAEQQKAREDQLKAREQQQQQQQQQQKAMEDQRKARDDQMKGREAEQQKAREQQQKAGEEQMKARAEQQKAREAEQQKAREEQMKARAEQQKAREEQGKGRGDPQQRQPQQQPQGATQAPADADARLSPQERALKRQEREKKAREDKEEDEKKGKAGR